MVNWKLDDKYLLLHSILEHTNPSAIPWDKIAVSMGPKFSSQACRGKYNSLRKGFKISEPTEAGASLPSSSTTAGITTKGKKPATTNTPTSAIKGRKRKAAEVSFDTNTGTAPKASKVKMGEDTAVMEAAEYLNTDQVEYGQGGAYQNVYPEHPSFLIDYGKAPYMSPYANDA